MGQGEMSVLDLNMSNRSVDVVVGDEVHLHLSENPTTGYRWHLETTGDGAVDRLDDALDAPQQEPGVATKMGSGGIRRWTFAAAREGTVVLRAELRRPLGSDAANVYEATVNVKCPPTGA